MSVLTPRQREVMELVAEGLSNRAIGRRLGISENTVDTHLVAVRVKLDVSSRVDVVRLLFFSGELR